MKLKDTVGMMTSEDYRERFKAEYYQAVIRYQKLKEMLAQWDDGRIPFEPACPRVLYELQIDAMQNYIAALEIRSGIEKITLEM